jgi:hypothetical protein
MTRRQSTALACLLTPFLIVLSARALPADDLQPDVQACYDQEVLRAELHGWHASRGTWSLDRCATADWVVIGKRQLWQFSLHLTALRNSSRAEEIRQQKALPPDHYLAKIFIGEAGKLERDSLADLGPDEFVGAVNFQAHWQPGMAKAVEIHFPPRESRLRRRPSR